MFSLRLNAMSWSKMGKVSCNQMKVDDIRAKHVFDLHFKMTIVLKFHQKLLFIKKNQKEVYLKTVS